MPKETSVSILDDRCRRLRSAARWNGAADQNTTGVVSSRHTSSHNGNRSDGTSASVIDRLPSGAASTAATINRRRKSRTRASRFSGSFRRGRSRCSPPSRSSRSRIQGHGLVDSGRTRVRSRSSPWHGRRRACRGTLDARRASGTGHPADGEIEVTGQGRRGGGGLRGHGSPDSRTGTKAVAVPTPGRRTDFHSTPGFPPPLLRMTWEPFAAPRRLSGWWQCPTDPMRQERECPKPLPHQELCST